MSNILLVTRPKYDDGTEYLSAYALELLKKVKGKILTKDFEGKEANKENVEKYIKSKNPKLVFLNGHGNECEVCGHKDKVIFSLKNVGFLKNRITYARACFSANVLGREAVKNNFGCFIGYIYPFSFWMDGERSATPIKDKVARMFINPSDEIIFSLVKGETAKKANEKSKQMMISNMRKILAMEQKKEPGATGMLQILWDNYEGQIVLGNENDSLKK